MFYTLVYSPDELQVKYTVQTKNSKIFSVYTVHFEQPGILRIDQCSSLCYMLYAIKLTYNPSMQVERSRKKTKQ